MKKKVQDITMEELLAELDRLGPDCAATGYSLNELVDKMGKSYKTVRGNVRRLIEEGRWALLGHRMGSSIDGRAYRLPVYGPKEWKGKQKK